ncbi:MAG: hypothetical protein ACI9FO_001373 [Methylophagaceae bacterium]|jgi:hypothetical protein
MSTLDTRFNIINKRRDERLKHVAKIRLLFAHNRERILDMRDFSSTGLFLFCSDTSIINLNDDVQVQTLELDDAPIVLAKVRRIEQHVGFAIEFVLD